MHFAGMLFLRSKQEFLYCSQLKDAIDAGMVTPEEKASLRCCFFDNPNTNLYVMHGNIHLVWASDLKACRKADVCSPVFVGQHSLEMFTVLAKDLYLHYVTMHVF